MTSLSPFRIDVLDASGVATSDGPLTTVVKLTNTIRLDMVGEATFVLPAADVKTRFITEGSQFDIYDEVDGYLGRYIFREREVSDDLGHGMLAVVCDEISKELTRKTVGFRRSYSTRPVGQVINDLCQIKTGWRAESDEDIGNTTVTYEGESIAKAVDVLRDRWKRHWRLKRLTDPVYGKVLEFGSFGASSGVVLTNVQGQVQHFIALRPEVGFITKLKKRDDASEVYNRVIPLGAGQGTAQITIQNATTGAYPIKSSLNEDDSLRYYIEDEDSLADFGEREKVLTLTNLRPIENTTAGLRDAANALKLAAEEMLRKYKDPRTSFDMTVRGLRKTPHVGETVRINYRGITDDYLYLEVDGTFFVLEATYARNMNGERQAAFKLSDSLERRTSDADAIAQAVSIIRSQQTHVQPAPFFYQDSQREIIGQTLALEEKRATFYLDVGDNVLGLTEVKIHFQTERTATVAIFGSLISQLVPDVRYSDSFPAGLHLWVDGVDVSVDKGGPWAIFGYEDTPGFSVDVTVDITDDIVNSPNGLYGTHTVQLRGTMRTLTPIFEGVAEPAANDRNTGVIHAALIVRGVTQAKEV